jgi:hypothetical protein
VVSVFGSVTITFPTSRVCGRDVGRNEPLAGFRTVVAGWQHECDGGCTVASEGIKASALQACLASALETGEDDLDHCLLVRRESRWHRDPLGLAVSDGRL